MGPRFRMVWTTTTAILCAYGFLKELRPSEPFLTEYLTDPRYSNITLDEADHEVYPLWTYSYLVVLFPVFLLTDLLRYKVVIVLEGFAYVATWALLVWGKGVAVMQVMQVVYGVATSTEVAYFAYVYAVETKDHYQAVSALTRVALLMGRFAGGVLAQALVSSGAANYFHLNVFSLTSVSLATVTSLFLPPVRRTVYFYGDPGRVRGEVAAEGGPPDAAGSGRGASCGAIWTKAARRAAGDFRHAYCGGNGYVLKWSLWWALAMCGNFQVGNYIQPLWETIHPSSAGDGDHQGRVGHVYNGAVEATTTLTGALLSYTFGCVRLDWSLIGEPLLILISVFNGAVLIGMAHSRSIWIAYAGYWGYRALYQMLITVASFEIAANIRDDSYGLIFGLNTFLALALQTILTATVADSVGLALPIRTQFVVYGGFWIGVSLLFLAIFVGSNARNCFGSYLQKLLRDGVGPPKAASQDEEDRASIPLGTMDPQ